MLKSCPSCSYIGNDGEHVCPFCKADLAVGNPRGARQELTAEDGHPILRSSGGSHESAFRMSPIGARLNGAHANGATRSAASHPNLIACYFKRETTDSEPLALGLLSTKIEAC